MAGFIKLYRKVIDNDIWNDKPFARGQAWIDLIFRANFEDVNLQFGNQIIPLKRGQFITSILKLSDDWGWSRHKVNDYLVLLKKTAMIDFKTDNKKTLITIVKYGVYNDKYDNEGQQKDNKRTTKGQQKDTDNNTKESKEGNNIENKFSMTETQTTKFKKFNDWINEHTPDVRKMKKQVTEKQFVTLIGEMPYKNKFNPDGSEAMQPGVPVEAVRDILKDIENKPAYRKDFESVFYCITRWHFKNVKK